MKLTIGERISLIDLLPDKGDFITLKRVQELKDSLIPTEQEEIDLEIKRIVNEQDPTKSQMFWKDRNYEADIEMGDVKKEIIANKLKLMDKLKTLTLDHLSLYEKFVENNVSEKKDDAKRK